MKYPDHEFDKLLSEAYITRTVDNVECFQWGSNRIPVKIITRNAVDFSQLSYSMWSLWMESFDNMQRAAVREKLTALRVQARLEGV